MPRLPMQLEFKEDGTYSGVAMGGAVQVKGTYQTKGKLLALDPPQMIGAAGNLTPTGGQMRLEMKRLNKDAIALSAPGLNFVMSRMGS